jgi:hypothetical protein
MTAIAAFSETDFGDTALHYAVDRLDLQWSTCMVCLCRYHNLVTRQGASLINLEGPTPTKLAGHHGWHRAGRFWKFCFSKSSEMAFSKSSLPPLLGPFINSFILICESMLSVGQDELLREMFVIKISITDIWLYIQGVSKKVRQFWNCSQFHNSVYEM